MAYKALVTKLQNYHKDPNSDRLWLADCYGEGVVVSPDMTEGELVLYLPSDGEIERWFGNTFQLFRKNEDGTTQGGYIDDNAHIRAVKLRGNQSSGIVISLEKVYHYFGDQKWKDGDSVDTINGRVFCKKYIPKSYARMGGGAPGTSYKGKRAEGIAYPEFDMHSDTAQLAYNMNQFKLGDKINITLKMHGTSQRSMKTYCKLPKGKIRTWLHMNPRKKRVYVCGTRRCVVTDSGKGYYGNDEFRLQHHRKLEEAICKGMEVFYEVVGYYGPGETQTIMPIANNEKLNDKKFVKEFGDKTIFSYGCEPGESKMYIYRITSNNGKKEWTPEEITEWCERYGFNRVPIVEDFVFTSQKDLLERINKYFEDLHDPVDPRHLKEGVVVRIVNRRKFTAYKSKTYEFKVLEGIIKDTESVPDMEEAQEEDI